MHEQSRMSDHQVRVTFEPQGRSVTVLPGTKIVEAAAQAGLTIDVPCGGQGLCGKCRVQITRGAGEPGERERARLSASDLEQGWRLACQAPILTTTTIHVPETSLFGSQHQILAQRQQGVAEDVSPAVRKIYVEMAPPTLSQCEADLTRLERHIGTVNVDLSLLRRLPSRMREGGFKGTVVMTDHHLIDFEPGDTSGRCFGMAFDIGTTTIVGSLNASLNGARWALLSANARKRAEELARAALHVELSQDTDFQMEFTEAMIFPEK